MAVVLTLLWDGTHSLWMRTSQPETAGTIHIAGAHGRIEIRRNRDGVPHVSAGSERDAHFGLGYVHAQDRLLQMEFQRRLGNGRLSEILGESALMTDSLSARSACTAPPPPPGPNSTQKSGSQSRHTSPGVNAYLDSRRNRQLPPEFNILGVEPEPWRPEDVLVWAKVVAWSISSNWDKELLRAHLIPKLGPAKTAQLMPAYTADGPTILPEGRRATNDRRRAASVSIQPSVLIPDSSTLSGLLDLNRAIEEQTGGLHYEKYKISKVDYHFSDARPGRSDERNERAVQSGTERRC